MKTELSAEEARIKHHSGRTGNCFMQENIKCKRIESTHSILSEIYDAEDKLNNVFIGHIPNDLTFSYLVQEGASTQQQVSPPAGSKTEQIPEWCQIRKGDSTMSLPIMSSFFDPKYTNDESFTEATLSQIADQSPRPKSIERVQRENLHTHNLRPKRWIAPPPPMKNELKNVVTPIMPEPRKKRPYFRKNKHPKEVIERVEAERLKRKRAKNRELAAKSRKKRKARMAFLENEHTRLTLENQSLTAELDRLRKELRQD